MSRDDEMLVSTVDKHIAEGRTGEAVSIANLSVVEIGGFQFLKPKHFRNSKCGTQRLASFKENARVDSGGIRSSAAA
jgi:hypothetical protein